MSTLKYVPKDYDRLVKVTETQHTHSVCSTTYGQHYLNKTPPIGAPNATETPAAAEALNISRFLASFEPYFGKRYEKIFPIQQAK